MENGRTSKALLKAREYEKSEAAGIADQERALFHLCSPVGWINDPNGFSFYNGECHLFYQYHPYSTIWGPMHWGHSTTQDFIKWTQLPAALAPDEVYDGHGCFSGTAIEADGKHILMYTGVEEQCCADGKRAVRQCQCLAVGDGLNYEKMETNPVIRAEQLPKGSSLTDFRDPKIWREDGRFYAVAGSRAADGSGQIPLFESTDLKEWKLVTILESCRGEYGDMWECPDFFSVDGKQLLIISPQNMAAKELDYHNGNGTVYIAGTYEKEQHCFTRENVGAIDFGLDFYAPQTVETPDGRRIMIGWMQSWDNQICENGRKWSGMMSIPREIHIRDGKLIQNPVRELEMYYGKKAEAEIVLNGSEQEEYVIPEICGRTLDMTVEAEGSYQDFEIRVARGTECYTAIRYHAAQSILTFDRQYCGLRKDYIASRSMKIADRGGSVKLRILMDRYSVELFANDGEQAMTSLIETPMEADGISVQADGECRLTITAYQICL